MVFKVYLKKGIGMSVVINKRLCAKINNGHVISKEEINANHETEEG